MADRTTTKYADVEYNRERRLITRLKEVFYWAAAEGRDQDRHLEALKEFWRSHDYQRATLRTRDYLRGWQEALEEKREREQLVYLVKVGDEWLDNHALKAHATAHPEWSYSELTEMGVFWKNDRTKPFRQWGGKPEEKADAVPQPPQ